MKLYNTLTLPASLYSSENLTIKAIDSRRITALDMKYVRKRAGYTWTDYKTNTKIAKELNITPVLDKMQDYGKNWIKNVKGMLRKRLPRIIEKLQTKKTQGIMGDLQETSGNVRPEWATKWPHSVIARWWWWWRWWWW